MDATECPICDGPVEVAEECPGWTIASCVDCEREAGGETAIAALDQLHELAREIRREALSDAHPADSAW